jgi:hypothetical protein
VRIVSCALWADDVVDDHLGVLVLTPLAIKGRECVAPFESSESSRGVRAAAWRKLSVSGAAARVPYIAPEQAFGQSADERYRKLN